MRTPPGGRRAPAPKGPRSRATSAQPRDADPATPTRAPRPRPPRSRSASGPRDPGARPRDPGPTATWGSTLVADMLHEQPARCGAGAPAGSGLPARPGLSPALSRPRARRLLPGRRPGGGGGGWARGPLAGGRGTRRTDEAQTSMAATAAAAAAAAATAAATTVAAAAARTRLRDVSERGAGREVDEPPRAAPARRRPAGWISHPGPSLARQGGASLGSHMGVSSGAAGTAQQVCICRTSRQQS